MKRIIYGILLLGALTVLASWGYIGHQAVGIIAENHLTPEATKAVRELLGGRSLGDIASWADEIRDDRTFPEHFVNVPLGLSRAEFENEVRNQPQDNVFKAVMANEKIISDAGASRDEKEKALKFIVHFIGDLHQPMHVSRREDLGGNKIQLQFEDKGTNLHSLWDSRMIDKQGLKAAEIAQTFDHATAEQITSWQSTSLIDCLWESYQISTKLYEESLPGSKLGEAYYKAHIAIVDERIEKAGIRLAGILNILFKSGVQLNEKTQGEPPVVKSLSDDAYSPIQLEDAPKHIGEKINVTATVAGFKEFDNMLLINLGKPYPDSPITLVFRGEAKAIGESIKKEGFRVLVIGKLVDYKGKPQIEITSNQQLFNPVK